MYFGILHEKIQLKLLKLYLEKIQLKLHEICFPSRTMTIPT
jgi:hypothetical protein